VAPAGSAGTVDITVNTAVGTTATSSADQFTYVFPFAGQSLASPPGPQQFQRTLVLTTGPPVGWGPQASARGRRHG
jgi:hypothetical protein